MRSVAVVALLALPTLASAADGVLAGPWKTAPFIRPALGATVFSYGSTTYTGVDLGAQGGLRYHQKRKMNELRFSGTTRVKGTYTVGSGVNGYDVRLGSFFGPSISVLGLQTGPDVFQNQYSYGSVFMDPTLGLAWPITLSAALGPVYLYGGPVPTWYLSGNRDQVDWASEDQFGFGHDFAWTAGASVDLGPVGLSVGYTHRITAYGPQKGFGLGFSL